MVGGHAGTLISGNLGFQEAAVSAGDAGTEAAVTWLSSNSGDATLFADVKTSGYCCYATSSDSCDLTGSTLTGTTNDVNWTGTDPGAGCAMDARIMPANSAGAPTGYTVAYVINRICNAPGDPNSAVASDGSTAMVCATYVESVRSRPPARATIPSTAKARSSGPRSITTGSPPGSAARATPSASSRPSSSYEKRLQHA